MLERSHQPAAPESTGARRRPTFGPSGPRSAPSESGAKDRPIPEPRARNLEKSRRAEAEATKAENENAHSLSGRWLREVEIEQDDFIPHLLSARAVALDSKILLSRDAPRPQSERGRRLVGHELQHLIQQKRDPSLGVQRSFDPTVTSLTRGALATRSDDELTEGRRQLISVLHQTPNSDPTVETLRSNYTLITEVLEDRGVVMHDGDGERGELAPPEEPQHANQAIATWTGIPEATVSTLGVFGSVDIAGYISMSAVAMPVERTGWTPGQYRSESEALGIVVGAGVPGAVFLERGAYVAYHVYCSAFSDFTWGNIQRSEGKPWTALRFDGGALAIVTTDGAIVRPGLYRTAEAAESEEADADLFPGAQQTVDGLEEAYGDFNEMDRGELIRRFDAALKVHALSVVSNARSRVEYEEERRSMSGRISSHEIAVMQEVAQELADLDNRLVEADYRRQESEATQRAANSRQGVASPSRRRHPSYIPGRDEARRPILARYPLLGRVDPRTFVAKSEEEQLLELTDSLDGVVEDIETTRNNIIDGTLNLWSYPNMVNATMAALSLDERAQRAITEHADGLATIEAFDSIALAVLSIGLGIGAAFASGGTALLLAGGALAVGVYDAVDVTQTVLAEQAGSNTDLDPANSIVPPDLATGYGWLVLAWIGVIADAADVVAAGAQVARAVRAVKAANGVLDEGIEILAMGDAALARRLREAASELGEALTYDTAVALGRRFGVPVEIADDMGDEVRIVRDLTTGEVRHILAGADASLAEILAHGHIVGQMRQYEGFIGGLRSVRDEFAALVGRGYDVPNPFPVGSEANDSWLEMQKLPTIIELRRSQLDEAVTAADQAAIARQIDVLENELRIHRGVVSRLSLERGVGVVRGIRETTDEAIASGKYPEIDRAHYYYRERPNPPPEYDLVRFTTANPEVAPPRRLVPADGEGNYVLGTGRPSRAEQAADIVRGWNTDTQTSYRALKEMEQQADVLRVVPLRAVTSTGKTFGEIDPTFAGRLRELLVPAYQRAGFSLEEAMDRADEVARAVDQHELIIVRGTDQLRAYNYRGSYAREVADPQNEVHHIIPLYLGGDHRTLVDLDPSMHEVFHKMVDDLALDEDGGQLLGSGAVRQWSEGLEMNQGAAVIMADGSIRFVEFGPDGTRRFLNYTEAE